MKNYEKLAKEIISLIGGKGNVKSLTHCATRLRFVLKDQSLAKDKEIQKLDGVITVAQAGGQYQVVVGTKVNDVNDEILKLIGENEVEDQDDKKMSFFNRCVDIISNLFQPILGVLCAAGILKGLNSLFCVLGFYADTSGTYLFLNAFGDAMFRFLPVLLGYTAAKKFKLNPFIGMIIGAVLCYPTIQLTELAGAGEPLISLFSGTAYEMNAYASLFGVPIFAMDYMGTVVPVVIIVYFASRVDRFLNKYIPDVLRFSVIPMLTLFVSLFMGVVIIGPCTTILMNVVTAGMQALYNVNTIVYGLIYGLTTYVFIIFGLHWGLIALWVNNISTLGYDNLVVMAITNVFTAFAAAAAVLVRSKDKKMKETAASSMLSAFCGITEPTLYGVLLPLKRPLITCSIANAVAGAIMGGAGVKEYVIGGWGVFEFPSFINPANGDIYSMIWTIIACAVGMILSFVLTFVVYKDDSSSGKERTEIIDEVCSPVKGEIVPLGQVDDSAFSGGGLGAGVAVIPEDGRIYAPMDGVIKTMFSTKHAVGILGANNVELLMHVGIDTVKLNGKYFTVYAKQGDEVKKGDLLLEVDLNGLKEEGYDTTTPITITNSEDFLDVVVTGEKNVNALDKILTVLIK